jgi:hypothetical protein
MVDANFRDVGISVVDGYYQGPAVFVTMDFGRPEDLPPPPPILSLSIWRQHSLSTIC